MRKLIVLVLSSIVGCTSTPESPEPAAAEPKADFKESIRQTVGQHMKELRTCYYETLDLHPAAEGKVVMEWKVDLNGKAIGTKLASSQGKRGIEAVAPCIAARINSWEFPKPLEVTEVNYPLYFSENGRKDFGERPPTAPGQTP